MSRVFIGIGHGGNDSGATANGVKESDVNLVIGLSCKAELERFGVIVGTSRIRDENDPLSEEIAEANAFKPNIAIDVHNNAGGGDGFEVYRQTNGYASASLAIAKSIETEVLKLGQNSRAVKTKLNSSHTDYFGFLRQIKCPSVLCEGAFIDSKDYLAIDTIEEQQALGRAYAHGILKYLGIDISVEPNKVEPVPYVPSINIGDKVKITGTYYCTGAKIPFWVKLLRHTVSDFNADKTRVRLGANGGINSWCYVKDVTQ